MLYPNILNQAEINLLWALDNEIERAEKIIRKLSLMNKIRKDDYEQRRKAGMLSEYERTTPEERKRMKKEEDLILAKADEIRQRRGQSNRSTNARATLSDEQLEELVVQERAARRRR